MTELKDHITELNIRLWRMHTRNSLGHLIQWLMLCPRTKYSQDTAVGTKPEYGIIGIMISEGKILLK
jgi:hypothetical protein